MPIFQRLASSTRVASWLGLRLAAGAAWGACGVACESDATLTPADKLDAGSSSDSTGRDDLRLTYSPMYSAFVEGHEAQLPVTLSDRSLRSKGAKFTSSDPSIATVADTAEGATITVKKDGVVVIAAVVEDTVGKAKLTITKFTEAQWLAGQARYTKGDPAIVPTAGGASIALAFTDPSARNPNGACSTCHGAQAPFLNVEATPTQTAGYTDEQLITIFTKGHKPEDWQDKPIPAFVWGKYHAWTVTEEEKLGLVAFLRTQTPRAQPVQVDVAGPRCLGVDASVRPVLCDNAGKPIVLPGGPDSGIDAATPMTGEAGAAATPDAGAPGDAG